MMIVCYYRYVLHSRHTVGYFECGKCTKYWEHKRAEILKENISECIETTGLGNCPKTYFIVFYYKILANSQNLLHVFDSKFPPMCIDVRWKTRELGLNFLFTYYNKTRRCDDRCTNMSRSLIRWIKWAQYGKMYCSKKKVKFWQFLWSNFLKDITYSFKKPS